MTVLIDGAPGQCVGVDDRGLLYGDGLFETLLVRDGRPEYWDRHLRRLASGCRALGIPAPDGDVLRDEAAAVCNDHAHGVLKLIVTRGGGGRGYRAPAAPTPRRIVSIHPAPAYPARFWEEGVALRWCETRLGLNPRLAGLKHLARLEQVVARGEWDEPEVPEGLMCDSQGSVVEGTMTNIFLVANGRVVTPSVTQCGVAGVMRGVVMDTAATLGIPCQERTVQPAEVDQADEIFVCNSVIGLWPVRRVDERDVNLGPVVRQLAQHRVQA